MPTQLFMRLSDTLEGAYARALEILIKKSIQYPFTMQYDDGRQYRDFVAIYEPKFQEKLHTLASHLNEKDFPLVIAQIEGIQQAEILISEGFRALEEIVKDKLGRLP